MTAADVLVGALDEAGYRLTRPRHEVAELIAARTGHFTAADLVADARRRPSRLGRATIFRALELLTELGAVERLDLPTGEHAYVACEPAHHHHLVCSGCGRSVEVADGELGDIVRRIGSRTGFRIDAHRLELFGRCPACRASAP